MSGLKTTFDLLSKTENEAAVHVLLPALDAPSAQVQESALRAILDRRSVVGQREVVRRMHTIDERWKAIINERQGRMTQVLRDAVLDAAEPQMCSNGCQAVLWFREYDLIPTLVNACEDESNPSANLAASTLLSLADLLYEELSNKRDYRVRRDPQLVRKNVTTSLEQSVQRFIKHKRQEPIEAFLVLAARDNATLMQILLDPHHPSYLPVVQTLTHSPKPGVMRLLLGYLDDPQSPSAVIQAILHRTDKKFVEHLLRKIGNEPSEGARANLRRFESIAWLRDKAPLVDELDDTAQHSAVQLVTASGMKPPAAYNVLSHLATKGQPGGRRAAVAALARFPGAEANNVVLGALRDPDPHVQAQALSQLRQRGIPGAMTMLVGLIDSPHYVVRQAARESLAEFSFKRYLAAFDMLDEQVRISTGRLVKKIDAQAIPELRQELLNAAGKRRMRAIAIARAIAAVPQVEDTLIELLTGDDHLLRAAAAEALGDCDSSKAHEALEAAAHDSSVIVQEAAVAALREADERKRNPAVPVNTPLVVGEWL